MTFKEMGDFVPKKGNGKHTDALAIRVMRWMDQCKSKETDIIKMFLKHQFNEGFAVRRGLILETG